MLFLGAISAEAQHYYRGYETVPSAPFIEKGTWMVGGNARYSQHVNDNLSMLVISNINSNGYSVYLLLMGFPSDASGKEPACQSRRGKRRRFES